MFKVFAIFNSETRRGMEDLVVDVGFIIVANLAYDSALDEAYRI